MKSFYASLPIEKKSLFWMVVASIVVFLGLTCFFFLGNPGIPLGWLLGSIIEIICYLTILSGTSTILGGEAKKSKALFAVLFSFLRLLLLIGGLVAGALCTYTFKNNYLNLWTVFAGYVPLTFAAILNLVYAKKGGAGK